MRAVIYKGTLKAVKTKHGKFQKNKQVILSDAVAIEVLKIPHFQESWVHVSRKKTTENASQRIDVKKQDRHHQHHQKKSQKTENELSKVSPSHTKIGKTCNRCVWLEKQKKTHSHICVNSDSEFHRVSFPHGKTRKGCNLYESLDSQIPQIVPEGMRLIEDLRGKEEFRNSESWIIGGDPNIDYYPDDFFDDKFSIAAGKSCSIFPESTFLCISAHDTLEWMIDKHPDCLKRLILDLHHLEPKLSPEIKRKMRRQLRSYGRSVGRWENWGLEPIYMKPENKPMTSFAPDYESMAKRIFSDGPCDFVLVRTTVHLAVFAAAVLGARKIILVGCSHKVLKGKAYAHKRGMDALVEAVEREQVDWYYGTQKDPVMRLRRDTIQLARAFEKYGIEIVRHRFDEDRNEFVFEEI